MNTLRLDFTAEDIKRFIPNVFESVEGEDLLIDKLRPYLEIAEQFYCENLFGFGDNILYPESAKRIGERIVFLDAFARCIPSIDLVLTPNGFGVVSSSAVAPASADRVNRYIDSLKSDLFYNVCQFIQEMIRIRSWIEAVPRLGIDSCALRDFRQLRQLDRQDLDFFSLLGKYHMIAEEFERHASDNYLGQAILDCIHNEQFDRDFSRIAEVFRQKEMNFVLSRKSFVAADRVVFWLIEPVISEIKRVPKANEIWLTSRPEDYGQEYFKNTTKGGYFF